jgi:membrane-bound lytic murein transglycosylase MltF
MPITFQRHLGDLNGMAKRRQIRALVVPSRSGFFYDKGQPRGIFYEAMEEFQRFANLKLKTGSLKIHVIYIPVRGEQIQTALLEGVGDVLAYGAIVTPEREKQALFTAPIATNVN